MRRDAKICNSKAIDAGYKVVLWTAWEGSRSKCAPTRCSTRRRTTLNTTVLLMEAMRLRTNPNRDNGRTP